MHAVVVASSLILSTTVDVAMFSWIVFVRFHSCPLSCAAFAFGTIFDIHGGPKTDIQFYFWDNFGNSAPILTILSLLQAEIHGA